MFILLWLLFYSSPVDYYVLLSLFRPWYTEAVRKILQAENGRRSSLDSGANLLQKKGARKNSFSSKENFFIENINRSKGYRNV